MTHITFQVDDLEALRSLLESAQTGREQSWEQATVTDASAYSDEDRAVLDGWHEREGAVSDSILRQISQQPDAPRCPRCGDLTPDPQEVCCPERNGTLTHTFVVERTELNNVTGDPAWTVVEYVDGVAKGGDWHWVRERFAHRAAALYRAYPQLHGRPTSELGELLFETDEDWEARKDRRYAWQDFGQRTMTESYDALTRKGGPGWTSVYDPDWDLFHVHTPEGEFRQYRRVMS